MTDPDYVEMALHRANMLEQSKLTQSSWQGGPTPAILRELASAITALVRERDALRDALEEACSAISHELSGTAELCFEARLVAAEKRAIVALAQTGGENDG